MKLTTLFTLGGLALGVFAKALPADFSVSVQAEALSTTSSPTTTDIALLDADKKIKCIKGGYTCDPNRPELCCDGTYIPTLFGYICGYGAKRDVVAVADSGLPTVGPSSLESSDPAVVLPTATDTARLDADKKVKCIKGGYTCDPNRPELCCDGTCIPTLFGYICGYAAKRDLPALAGPEVSASGTPTSDIVPDSAAEISPMPPKIIVGLPPHTTKSTLAGHLVPSSAPSTDILQLRDDNDDQVQCFGPGEICVSFANQCCSGICRKQPDSTYYRCAVTTTCIDGGWSCDPSRPELCCSNKCVFTLWSGYICGYEVKQADAVEQIEAAPVVTTEVSATSASIPSPSTEATNAVMSSASVLEKKDCNPDQAGCSACSQCCIFNGNTAGCGQPAAVQTVLHGNECKPMGQFGIGMYAVWISECTGGFDTCILYQDANCPGGQTPTHPERSRQIHSNTKDQCTNWAGAARDFWVSSIRCWGALGGGD